jgi:uncharacterized protein involved in outer membrane biogenesis
MCLQALPEASMRRRSKIAIWIAAVIAAIIVVFIVVIATYDWNRARPWIDDKVAQAIGRPFVIKGDLSVHWRRDPAGGDWLPGPVFTANDVVVGNPDWAKPDTSFAHLEQIHFRLSLWPLLARRIVVPSVQLKGPGVDLLKRADGKNNWTFAPVGGKQPSSWHLDLQRIGFDQGTLTLDDAPDRIDAKVEVSPLGKPIPFADVMGSVARSDADKATAAKPTQDYYFGLKASGHYHGAPVRGTGKIGGVLAMRSQTAAFPLQADVRIGDVHIDLTGSLTNPRRLSALDLHLRLSGASMAHLYPIFGVTLPDTAPFDTQGHLTARLGEHGSTFKYEDFNGHVGGSDIHGDVTYATGSPRPKLTGKLWSNQLQFADLAPLVGGGTAARNPDADQPKQPAGKVLPVATFRTDRWKAMDADIGFNGKHVLHGKALPIQDLQAHVVLDNGRLSLDPLDFGIAGGNATSTIHLNGRAAPMQGTLDLRARNLQLKQLLPKAPTTQATLGEINGAIKLSGTGNSIAALLGSSDGELKMLVENGTVSRELMELAGLNIGNYLLAKLFGDEPVPINCAATDLVAKDGLTTTRLALIDTRNALVDIDGTVNFATEGLDLTVSPHTKGLRILSLRSPLYVRGTFAHPQAGVKAGPLLLRGAGALALAAFAAPAAALLPLIAPSRDRNATPCAALLAKMHKAPTAPPPGTR